jgi:hypothetical protein
VDAVALANKNLNDMANGKGFSGSGRSGKNGLLVIRLAGQALKYRLGGF